jgi:hypothetical protein
VTRKQALPDPGDVVSGRARASIEQLFGLIHAANPTEKGLSSKREAERYALKARLQSLLIRQHADAIEVALDSGDDEVVSIRHRIDNRDACHAKVAMLDDDARNWIETRLARPTFQSDKVVVDRSLREDRMGSAQSLPFDPLAAAEAALEAYDYEEARHLLEDAFESLDGRIDAARALLGLFVDHLVDDETALALEARLSPEARTDTEVKGLLAVAAARHGDATRARRWLCGAVPTRIVEALVLLADAAARSESADELRKCIDALADIDPAHPELQWLWEAHRSLRAQHRAPAEMQLAEAQRAERWHDVERIAKEILATWPDSWAARVAARKVETRRKAEKGKAHVARAWAAWEKHDPASVIAAVKAARDVGGLDREVTAWLDEAEATAREQVEISRVARVRELLDQGRLGPAFEAWLALSEPLRREVRATHGRAEFGWLETMPDGAGRAAAAVAIGEAQKALDCGRDDVAMQALAPHDRLLRNVRVVRRIRQTIAARAAAANTEIEIGLLAKISEARANEDFDLALSLVAELAPEKRRCLKDEIEEDRAKAAKLRQREQAVEKGNLVAARDLAVEAGDENAALELSARIRRDWHVRTWEGLDVGVKDVLLPPPGPCPNPVLLDGGNAFVNTHVLGGWIFVRVIDLPAMTVRRVISFRAPGPFVPSYAVVDEDVLTIVDQEGALLAFRLQDGEIVRRLPRPVGTVSPACRAIGATLAPGGRYLWLSLNGIAGQEVIVFDTARWPLSRTLAHPGIGVPLLGGREPMVAVFHAGQPAKLYAANGDSIGRKFPPGLGQPTRIAILPDGLPFCAIRNGSDTAWRMSKRFPPEEVAKFRPDPTAFYWHRPSQEAGDIVVIPGTGIGFPHQLATAKNEGCVYVLAGIEGASEVWTFQASDGGDLQLKDNQFWTKNAARLLTDAHAGQVRLVAPGDTGVEFVPLDGTAACADMNEAHQRDMQSTWPMHGLDFDLGCGCSIVAGVPNADAIVQVLGKLDHQAQRAWIEAYKKGHAEDAGAMADIIAALARTNRGPEGGELYEAISKTFAEHPRWRFIAAMSEARMGHWEEVAVGLDDADPSQLIPLHAQHLLHLRGVAWLRCGDRERGAADLRKAATIPGKCQLKKALALLDVLDGCEIPTAVTDTATYFRSRIGPVVHGILAADRCLETGDAQGALATLDTVLVWRSRDRQALARLATAWLLVHPSDPTRRLWRRISLASFVGAHEDYLAGYGHDLPIPPHSWDGARLEALAERVRVELVVDLEDGT